MNHAYIQYYYYNKYGIFKTDSVTSIAYITGHQQYAVRLPIIVQICEIFQNEKTGSKYVGQQK
jgi:hypothetical protein